MTNFKLYNCHNRNFIITRPRYGVSHLLGQKFNHSFQDTINPLCSCDHDLEFIEHFCIPFVNERHNLLSTIGNVDHKLLENSNTILTQNFFLEIRHLIQMKIIRFLML